MGARAGKGDSLRDVHERVTVRTRVVLERLFVRKPAYPMGFPVGIVPGGLTCAGGLGVENILAVIGREAGARFGAHGQAALELASLGAIHSGTSSSPPRNGMMTP